MLYINRIMDILILKNISHTLFSYTAHPIFAPRVDSATHINIPAVLIDDTAIIQGQKQQAIQKATKKEKDIQLVQELIKKSNRSIISISAIFPWDFFPNTISVEESRLTIVFHQFLTSQTHSINIKDISNVFLEASPFFATLQIVSRTYVQNEITLSHLNPQKASKVKMIIEGLRTLSEHNIETSNYEIPELIAKIEEFHSNKTVKGGEAT